MRLSYDYHRWKSEEHLFFMQLSTDSHLMIIWWSFHNHLMIIYLTCYKGPTCLSYYYYVIIIKNTFVVVQAFFSIFKKIIFLAPNLNFWQSLTLSCDQTFRDGLNLTWSSFWGLNSDDFPFFKTLSSPSGSRVKEF